jgi:hypothetical protein
MNFRDGFRIEPDHILAHRGAHFGMGSHRASLNLREITAKTACVAKCCGRQKCTHEITASWGAEKRPLNHPLAAPNHAVCATEAARPD